ncbi:MULTISPECIES: hypothetical protein [Streptomyces]|nr:MULTISPECIES: hypothetical protein [Streptomyces]
MSRRLLPLLVAALMSVAGCTTVSSRPTPGAAPERHPAARPSVLQAPPREPSARAALVRTGHGRPAGHGTAAEHTRNPGPGRRRVPATPPRAQAPAAPPVLRHRPERPPVRRRPAPRPRPASRRPAVTHMRDLCRQADGVAAPEIARLCHDTYG